MGLPMFLFNNEANVSGPDNLSLGKPKAMGSSRGRLEPTEIIIFIIVIVEMALVVMEIKPIALMNVIVVMEIMMMFLADHKTGNLMESPILPCLHQ